MMQGAVGANLQCEAKGEDREDVGGDAAYADGSGGVIQRFRSSVDTSASSYADNLREMTALTDQLHERLELSLGQGNARTIARHYKRGQLTARERIELVLDQDSPFLELMPLAGWDQDEMTLGGSTVGGIGLVCGVETMVTASVPTLKGGTVNKVSLTKALRLSEIAYENRLPTIGFTQSGGADLRQQYKVFHRGGVTFRELAKRSKAGIPSISVVFGSSTAGGAYTPGMSDYVIMVKNKAKVFLGGPPLVKMATGEEVDDESLGGADMHSKISGVSDYLASNEYSAIAKAREVMFNLNWKKMTPLPKRFFSRHVEEPFYDPEELLGIVPANIRIPYDIREVIARIVDGSRISEFKPLYGSTLVTCWAKIHGIQIGIIANNNGVIFSESAQKGTQFIDLCNQRSIPILFIQNVTGFMVGKKYEEGGIIKYGSKFINAVSNSGVPHITVVIGASYGAGNYAMCGRAYRPRFLFSWPNSKCSVMGPDQLTGVMDIVLREGAARAGTQVNEEAATMQKEMLRQLVVDQSDVYYTSSRVIDDGIIDPRDTRHVVGMCLSAVYGNEVKGANHPGIARM